MDAWSAACDWEVCSPPRFSVERIVDHILDSSVRVMIPGHGNVEWEPVGTCEVYRHRVLEDTDHCHSFLRLEVACVPKRSVAIAPRTGLVADAWRPGKFTILFTARIREHLATRMRIAKCQRRACTSRGATTIATVVQRHWQGCWLPRENDCRAAHQDDDARQ